MRNVVGIVGLLGLCTASGVWALERGGRTAWFLLFSLTFLSVYALLAYVMLRRGLQEIGVSEQGLQGPTQGFVGDSLPLPVRLPGVFRFVPGAVLQWEEVWVHQGTGERVVIRELLPAQGQGEEVIRLMGLNRGLYVHEARTVSASDAFGLLRLTRRSGAGGALWVLPRPQPSAAVPPAWASVPQVSGTRPYAPGDPLRWIHWRTSARTGELRAKVLEQPAEGRQLVVLDAAGAGGSAGAALWADPALTAAVEAAAGLAQRGLELGARVRLAVADGQGSAAEAQGRGRLPELLRLLAAVPCGGSRPEAFAELAQREGRQAAGAAVTLVTARADTQLPAALRGLPRGAAHVLFVPGPGGAALPESWHGWRRQLEALGCRVTVLAAEATAASQRGGDGHAASSG
ncbi:DUF58 domain-containing protein [Paenibacillus cremeus]|nr:DUF58 domain-containing protein [Paenibacillus cremeus]